MINNYIFQTYIPLIADLVCFLVWFSMPSRMLVFKKEKRWIFFVAMGIHMTFAVVCRSNPILLTSPLKTIILMAVLLIYLFLCYEETKAQKLIAFSLWTVTMTIADMMAVIVMSLLQISITKPISGLPVHLISGLIVAVFSYFLMFATSILYNKIRRKNVTNKMWQFHVVIMSQLMLLLTIGYISYKNDYTIESMLIRAPAYTVLLIITVVFAVLADIFLYKILLTNSQNYELKRELEIIQVKESLELEYYEKLKKSINETRRLNHDFSNAVMVIENIINSTEISENKKLAADILEGIKDTLKKTKTKYYCENELVNLIILSKSEEIQNADIDFSANLNLPQNINVKNFDLCRIFTNILDNARDACMMSHKKDNAFIVLSSKLTADSLCITCENYYDTAINKSHNAFKSTKQNHRGLGIEVLKEIASNYNGYISVQAEDNIFTIKITLKIS